MDARFFDVLHNPGDVHVLTVGQRVHVHFNGVFKEFVDEHGMLKLLLADMQREVFRHLLVVIDDHHGPPAKHVARADHNGSLKTFAVFGAIDGVRAGAEDGHARAQQRHGEV